MGETGRGRAALLDSMDSYVGYAGSLLRGDQGSIVFRYKPIPNLTAAYATKHPSWIDAGNNRAPRNGFMIDTIGWNAAPKGSFQLSLNPAPGGSLVWAVWDGSLWHYASWTSPTGWEWKANRWYEIGVTWGPRGMSILVNGEEKVRLPDVVQVSTSLPWFLGQAPWYWPYGPHTMMGSYDELRVFEVQLETVR